MNDFTQASGRSVAVRRSVAPRLAAVVAAVVLLVAGCKSMATGNSGATSDEQGGYGQRGAMEGGSNSGGHPTPSQ